MTCLTGIVCQVACKLSWAQSLSETLNLPIVDHSPEWALKITETCVSLVHPKHQQLLVNFADTRLQLRSQNVLKETLLKACSQPSGSYVIDATAGWGIDSFLLASFGYRVLMLEQSTIMSVLLQDGLERYKVSKPDFSLYFKSVNALDYLSTIDTELPDVIYLDPMFPHSRGKRLSKLSMSLLAQLSTADESAADKLLDVALQKALKRVVVKRYGKHDYLLKKKPTFSLAGRSHRFDVYCQT